MNGVLELLTSDTREVRAGSTFYLVPSASRKETLQEWTTRCVSAQEAGAIAIVAEIPRPTEITVSFFQVPDVRRALAEAAAERAGYPARGMLCIGVTGTSGKTTTTFLIESILREAGFVVGLIGTVICRYPGFEQESTHTTPGPVQLEALLAQMRAAGCTAVVMEVSSHAIEQRRVDGVYFDVVAFTNLSPEHLDYHRDMEEYFSAKQRLFDELARESHEQGGKDPRAVICTDDAWGIRMAESWERRFGREKLHRVRAGDLAPQMDLQGMQGNWQGAHFRTSLTGKFNAANLAVALGVGQAVGLTAQQAIAGIVTIEGVPGRMERVSAPDAPFAVLVDYAHKPDALEKVLNALRGTTSRLTVVFGCGGDRDRGKRPLMGALAARLADRVILTSDNPRTENPDHILKNILVGIQSVVGGVEKSVIESDRARAIENAIETARPGELILIAGKGHETYQIIGTHKIPFDDRQVARAALQSLGLQR